MADGGSALKPPRLQYARPDSLADALMLLSRHAGDAAVLAGGQSLMPMLNLRVAQPAILIDINSVPELDRIRLYGESLSIGGRTRHNDVLRSPTVQAEAPLLTQALAHVAHEAIRNRGTLGGSLALADPAAELPACAVCLEAEIVATSVRGERRIAAGEFFQGLYTTALEPDELVTLVDFPVLGAAWRFGFDEVSRRRGDFAIAGLALAIREDGATVADCRLALFGVEAFPRRLRVAEDCLRGAALGDDASLARAQAALRDDLEPIEGGESPPQYRVHLACELLARTVRRLAQDGSSREDD
jgi:carbon-monoxide dehydrogenase medium subunit